MDILELDPQKFEESLKSKKWTVVDAFADWCGTCRLIAPKFRELSTQYEDGETQFFKINAEKSERFREMVPIDSLPYFAVFKEGAFVGGLSSGKIEAVKELIDEKRK